MGSANGAAEDREVSVLPHAKDFYNHYWSCDRCNQYRLCRAGRGLWMKYEADEERASIERDARRVMAMPVLRQRQVALAAMDRHRVGPVKEKLRELWDGAQARRKRAGGGF